MNDVPEPARRPAAFTPPATPAPVPLEIRVRRAEKCLEIDFEDGVLARLPAEYLRVESPSAEVQGHKPADRITVPGKKEVGISFVEPIGHYAIRIRFTDGHDTGIYSWSLLHQLNAEQPERWRAYLDALARQGLRRDA